MKISLTKKLLQVGIFLKCGFVLLLQNLFPLNFCVLVFFVFMLSRSIVIIFSHCEFDYHLYVGWDFELN
jgi:hypothetical protein